jgi:3-methylcrotonyl-CoA carboxylase alpha subunit
MFKKILIANRGEIACRVAHTAHKMGIQTVAVYSDIDRHALHLAACHESRLIGGAAPKDSYLNIERILQAAQQTGSQAIHPGYGFLSENADFARACDQAGLVFIGPPASAIEAMGLKSQSKQLMSEAGIPLVPGYHGEQQETEFLQQEAEKIGYPVLIKASAGGGGKGMRIVRQANEFVSALSSCQREALNSFGNAHVLIERYLSRPRHIEIQIFADRLGQVVHLFERDCSVQRRHQKVLEEAPAPGMTADIRQQMGQAAVAAAQAVEYVGAGTVEFIFEPASDANAEQLQGRFYFMEMNTRLQVEHPVTEAITGIDLVEWQLRVAAGEPLPLQQQQITVHGHSIEARICAENPQAQFLPATGRLHHVQWPDHHHFKHGPNDGNQPASVRLDAAVGPGSEISPYYDSMIAKLIVWGETREQALAQLTQALKKTHLVGLQTNVAFLRRLVLTQSFSKANLDTSLIEREHDALFNGLEPDWPLIIAGVTADLIEQDKRLETGDPWSHRRGWRLHGAYTRRFELNYRANADSHLDQIYIQAKRGAGDTHWHLQIQQPTQNWQLDFSYVARPCTDSGSSAQAYDIFLEGQREQLTVYKHKDLYTVYSAQGVCELQWVTPWSLALDASVSENKLPGVRAPMPGKVVALHAQPNQAVKQGQVLAVIEAMKMEHTLTAPCNGIILELYCSTGDQVSEGLELMRLEPLP